MKIYIYDIVKIPIIIETKNLSKFIHGDNYLTYFWNVLDDFNENGVSKYGGFITPKELKKLIGKQNYKYFKDGEERFTLLK